MAGPRPHSSLSPKSRQIPGCDECFDELPTPSIVLIRRVRSARKYAKKLRVRGRDHMLRMKKSGNARAETMPPAAGEGTPKNYAMSAKKCRDCTHCLDVMFAVSITNCTGQVDFSAGVLGVLHPCLCVSAVVLRWRSLMRLMLTICLALVLAIVSRVRWYPRRRPFWPSISMPTTPAAARFWPHSRGIQPFEAAEGLFLDPAIDWGNSVRRVSPRSLPPPRAMSLPTSSAWFPIRVEGPHVTAEKLRALGDLLSDSFLGQGMPRWALAKTTSGLRSPD